MDPQAAKLCLKAQRKRRSYWAFGAGARIFYDKIGSTGRTTERTDSPPFQSRADADALRASTDERIDDVHTGLREIDTVPRSDRQTVDNRGRCDEAILDWHGFPGFAKARQ